MKKLLIDENPLMIIPSLAARIGLNEAIILQQIHYWLLSSSHRIEGRIWIYNSYKEWQKQFPFWSESTIKRIIRSLEKKGYLISANHNKLKIDHTKWYTIDYKKIEDLAEPNLESETDTQNEPSSAQVEPAEISECPPEETILNQPLPERTSKITSEKKTYVAGGLHSERIITCYNPNADKNYEHILWVKDSKKKQDNG